MKDVSRFKIGRLRSLSPGTILGLLALTVALGGTAAANLPGKNSVISSDIKNGAFKAPDIKDGAVQAAELGPITLRTGNQVSITDTTGQDGDFTSNGKSTVACDPGEVLISAYIN
ncbi:MAG: hypothetical protein ACREMY_32840, partial [bacterium]